MNCKFCDSPMEDDQSVCPACGVDNSAVEDALLEGGEPITSGPAPDGDQPAAERAGAETAPDGDLYDDPQLYDAAAQSEPLPDAQTDDAPKPKRAGKGLLIGLGLVALAAVAALVLALTGVLGGVKDGVDTIDVNMVDKDGVFIAHDFSKDTMTDEEAAAVIATAGKTKLTNAELSYYYWQQYYNLYNTYGTYISMLFDPEQPLSTQMYDDTHSWQDMLIQASVTAFRQNVALGAAADKAGVTLTEEYTAYLDSMTETMATDAQANGFDSPDALLQSVYGAYATMDGYLEYARSTMLASTYLETLYADIAYADEDITRYFDEHTGEFEGMTKEDPNMVNVRHILIQPAADADAALDESGQPIWTDENWAAAEKKATDLYAQWKAGEATEDSFSALATDNSMDGSAQNGGLIEDIFPGQMTPEFNDWCFDTTRKTGDNALVKTQFGYHIMFFSTVGEHPYWYSQAESKLSDSLRRNMLDELVNKTKLKVDYTKAVLVEPVPAAAPDSGTPVDTTTGAEAGQ